MMPYRFRAAAGGTHAGWTFVYYERGMTVSYRTEDPQVYHLTPPHAGGTIVLPSAREMTPYWLSVFEAVPLLDEEEYQRSVARIAKLLDCLDCLPGTPEGSESTT